MNEARSQPTCPMTHICKGMSARPAFEILTMIPGLVLIGFGVLVLFYPQILAWLIAILMIMMGIGALFMANKMRKFSARMNSGQGH